MTATKAALYILGGILEIAGIFLVAAPDLAPVLRTARAQAFAAAERARVGLQRILRKPRTVTHTMIAEPGSIGVSGHLTAKLSVTPSASLNERVESLLRRADEAQERLNDLDRRLTDEAQARDRAVAAAQDETERRLREAIAKALDAHKRLRLVGIGLLTLGAVLLNLGNFA